ncbi:antitoxin component YwqK of YwqJK toxin-antitoxin module [Breznakibacter xylanolyticus]|uniref:Antitoxin component YwqK of YwqJK toxin-antitoxin module n=1 Tax=Breznakibacter xylanolyticus TaxID=990 RepID=A0A2W7MU78_9BACT|nr:hypothetical protein [Breznakibacter xylanolyticus]PZX11685.1 antitoxin component YwqK of YwqJK toxin-antitoxin module [Breznakibacter xylanolyticus]
MNYLKKSLVIVLFCVLNSHIIYSQKTEKFLDYMKEECAPNSARFYSLTVKNDSGYLREDYYIKERKLHLRLNYLDSLSKVRDGIFQTFHSNGRIEKNGYYHQNEKDGLWMSFYWNGYKRDSVVYQNGKEIGTSLYWHPNGFLRDSVYLLNDGSGSCVSWFDNGVLASLGRYSAGKKQNGRWKYYHMNGKLSSIEVYNDSLLITKQYFNENGEAINDTTLTDRKAEFKGGPDAWSKYISKNIYFPSNYKIVNADEAIVIVAFTVNENGEIENVYPWVPLDKAFDEIATKAIEKSPKWIPANEHNRNVEHTYFQVVKFRNNKQ